MPITHIHDEITKNLQNIDVTCMIYLDLKKAFDTVCIEIPLKKLHFIGVRGSLLKILTSYLSNRQQVTKIHNNVSGKKGVITGVPQGSIIGPLLFILYVNDMHQISNM